MAKTPTTRKVTKVARTGGGRTKRGQTSWFFPTLVTAVVVLGTFLIVFSRNERQPDLSPPRVGIDHWHSAIGFYLCDPATGEASFQPNLADNGRDPLGIHTHGDGVVHTHPFSSQAAGRNAQLRHFFDTMQITVNENQLRLPGTTVRNGDKCGGQDGIVQVKVWDTRSPTDPGRILEGPPGNLRLGNNQLITVAFVPRGADIPKPPSEAQLDNLSDVPSAATSIVPPTTAVEPTTTTEPPATTVP
ncbi:MAG TPA: hypothetical protein VM390_06545 [Acidimicrobiales bacterium]|nr:hypothetical protein [Acidimicrobiales bacterium]